ncbi:hypothetical protein [Jiella sp. M17.18]|uniref:hypothetical protein n=1 Tax=Jiella sp. M17.18 TaxID=3234247 RepID=UPI0034DE7420
MTRDRRICCASERAEAFRRGTISVGRSRWREVALTLALLLAAASARAEGPETEALPNNNLRVPPQQWSLRRLLQFGPGTWLGGPKSGGAVIAQVPTLAPPQSNGDAPCSDSPSSVQVQDLSVPPEYVGLVNLLDTSVAVRVDIGDAKQLVVLRPMELNFFNVRNSRLVQVEYRINGVTAASQFVAGNLYRLDFDGSRWTFLGRGG